MEYNENMGNSILTLNDFLQKQRKFIVPYYQRGYIWGKSRGNGTKNSVEYMLESITASHKKNADLFLQGITVTEDGDSVTLIDGQQRMTFLYLLFCYLGYDKSFSIEYTIRKESQNFLEKIKQFDKSGIAKLCTENKNEAFQDIYYFKKTIRTISKANLENGLLDFLLNKIKFLYVPIAKENAEKVFSMMNGNKAVMKDSELVKAEILRLVSPEIEDATQTVAWEQNTLRSRYAREWDRWLYWWNKKSVKEFFQTTDIMGWLLPVYFKSKTARNKKTEYNFQTFSEYCLKGNDSEQKTKEVFYDLRQLQKTFEDVYNSVSDEKNLHNKIGSILCILNKKDREQFVIDYFAKKEISEAETEKYYKYVFLSLFHAQILNAIRQPKDSETAKTEDDQNENDVGNQIEMTIAALSNDDLYRNNDDCKFAYLQLLRLNVEADTSLGRAFDFSVWKNRSLEHIFPKSKMYHVDENGKVLDGNNSPLNREDITDTMLARDNFKGNGSEHCIGNLVLLYRDDNSSFGDKTFSEKKKSYFDMDSLRTFQSRTLLHSMSVFASDSWGVKEIQENKQKVIEEVKEYYGCDK